MSKLTFITLEKLLEMKHNNEEFQLVEVLAPEKFAAGHIPGAINIPYANFAKEAVTQLDKEKPVVVYCSNYQCTASSDTAKILMEIGFKNVVDFSGGKKLWEQNDLPLVTYV